MEETLEVEGPQQDKTFRLAGVQQCTTHKTQPIQTKDRGGANVFVL